MLILTRCIFSEDCLKRTSGFRRASHKTILRFVTDRKVFSVRMSEDKIRIKDSCSLIRMVYDLDGCQE
jgi:hypothetical protein